jgi:hypothetical protein
MWRMALCLGLCGLGCVKHPDTRASVDPASVGATSSTSGLEKRERAENEHLRRIGDQALLVTADPELEFELQHLVDLLWQMHSDGARIYDGQILALGWTTVWFRAERGPEGGEYFVIASPDYGDETGQARKDDLSDTLRVLAAQRPWLRLTGVSAEPVDFDQHLLVVRGALETEQVFLVRVESPGGRMTGWRLAPVDLEHASAEVDSIPVHEVWRKRPELLQTMLFPAGWMAYYDREQLVTLVDPSDQVAWSAAEASREGGSSAEAPEGAQSPEAEDPETPEP